MILTNSHTAATPKRTMEKATESPNTSTPTASETIKPSTLNTAPITFPHTASKRPTNLNTQTRNKKANIIPIILSYIPFRSDFSKRKNLANTRSFIKPLAGLEPATHALRMRCATNCATMAYYISLKKEIRPLQMQQPLFDDLTGNRTRVYAVRGRRLDRLTIRPK